MTVRAEHITPSDHDLLLLAGRRLIAWAHEFTFHEFDGESWYRTRDDDPAETAELVAQRLDEAEQVLCEARRLLAEGLRCPRLRALVEAVWGRN